jgi:hypothetical protein
MIDVRVGRLKGAVALETPPPLNIQEHRPNHGKRRPFAAEQELVQIGDLADDFEVLLTHIPDPGSSDQVGN